MKEGVAQADNIEVLAELPDASVDLIYVDPPFGTGARRQGQAGGFADRSGTAEFVAFMHPRLEACHRVLRSSGSLFVHLDFRTVHHIKVALDAIFGEEALVNEIVWCYSVGGKGRRSFGRKHDTILWYARSPQYAFYPDRVRVPRKAGSHMKVVRDADGNAVQVKRDRKTGKVYSYPVLAGKIPDDTWTDIETLNRSDRERTGWPTQKPAALLRRIILATTQPGDLVADFFCGSGTTLAVAAELGRRYLGVDVSAEAVAITRSRLQRARAREESRP
jgi:DNA modification methylase